MKIGADKEAARARAILLLPTIASELQRHRDHNRSEALLLGIYALAKGLTA
jgi:hypothetical protein